MTRNALKIEHRLPALSTKHSILFAILGSRAPFADLLENADMTEVLSQNQLTFEFIRWGFGLAVSASTPSEFVPLPSTPFSYHPSHANPEIFTCLHASYFQPKVASLICHHLPQLVNISFQWNGFAEDGEQEACSTEEERAGFHTH